MTAGSRQKAVRDVLLVMGDERAGRFQPSAVSSQQDVRRLMAVRPKIRFSNLAAFPDIQPILKSRKSGKRDLRYKLCALTFFSAISGLSLLRLRRRQV